MRKNIRDEKAREEHGVVTMDALNIVYCIRSRLTVRPSILPTPATIYGNLKFTVIGVLRITPLGSRGNSLLFPRSRVAQTQIGQYDLSNGQ